MLGSLILYLKGMRIMMFQLSGFYCRAQGLEGLQGESCCEDLKDKDYDRPGCPATSVWG